MNQLSQCITLVGRHVADITPDQHAEFFGKATLSTSIEHWKCTAQSLSTTPLPALIEYHELTLTYADRAQARSMVRSRQAFMNWVKRMWPKKPGAAHRRVKAPSPEPLPRGITHQGDTTADPTVALERVSCCARQEPLEPLRPDQLETILRRQAPNMARG
eukprot:442185-Pyramimonas_sp.AAC.1